MWDYTFEGHITNWSGFELPSDKHYYDEIGDAGGYGVLTWEDDHISAYFDSIAPLQVIL
jgi:hypothetical protein